jgi:hypothetical protein
VTVEIHDGGPAAAGAGDGGGDLGDDRLVLSRQWPDRPDLDRAAELELPASTARLPFRRPSTATIPNSGVIRSETITFALRREPSRSASSRPAPLLNRPSVGPRRCLDRVESIPQSWSIFPAAAAARAASTAALPGSAGAGCRRIVVGCALSPPPPQAASTTTSTSGTSRLTFRC